MTQFELDSKLRELRAQMNEEYKEIDSLMVENLRRRDMVKAQINTLKEVLNEHCANYQELLVRKKDIARAYRAKRIEIFISNQDALGVPTDKGNDMTKREAHELRRNMIKMLQEKFADVPNIDVEHINVQFKIDGDSVQFDAIIPKKD